MKKKDIVALGTLCTAVMAFLGSSLIVLTGSVEHMGTVLYSPLSLLVAFTAFGAHVFYCLSGESGIALEPGRVGTPDLVLGGLIGMLSSVSFVFLGGLAPAFFGNTNIVGIEAATFQAVGAVLLILAAFTVDLDQLTAEEPSPQKA